MKLRFARTLVLAAGLLIAAPLATAVPQPVTPPRVNPLAGQQKAVVDARANLVLAKKQLQIIRRKVETDFAGKPDFKAAKEGIDKAKLEYDGETRKVQLALEKDPAYVAQKAKRDKAQAVIDQSHRPPVTTASGDDPVKLTDDEITAAVKDHQDAALAMIDMQKRAEEADSNFATLKQKRTDAQAAWDALQSQIDEAMKADPTYPQAQQAVDSAEAQVKQSTEALEAASKQQRESQVHTTPTPTRPKY